MYRKKVYLNIFGSVFTQLVSIIVSLVLPRVIIQFYGSEINGLVSSTLQIINYFALFEGSIAAAAGFELFKAIKERDEETINGIFSAVNVFYYKIGILILLFTVAFSLFFPIQLEEVNYFVGVSIILLSSVVNNAGFLYYFKYNLIIFSDQKQYITLFSNSGTRLITTIIQIVLILNSANILVVIAVTPLLTIARLHWIKKYTLKHYPFLDAKHEPNNSALDQKWDAMSINVSKMLKMIVPIVYISVFYGFIYSSIYTVHSMIFNIGRSIIDTTSNGLSATMGNIVAEGNKSNDEKVYLLSSNIIFILNTILAVCFIFLASPFVYIYVGNTSDVSYYSPILVISFVINEVLGNFNFTPNLLIRATGKFKQTSKSSIVEIVLTILITPVGLIFFGFQGVLIGSIISAFIRIMYIMRYCRKDILSLSYNSLIKNCIVYGATLILLVLLFNSFSVEISDLKEWIIYAFIVFGISTISVLAASFFFLRDNFITIYNLLRKK